jgi:DNA-binding transcriptional LysR family regulator
VLASLAELTATAPAVELSVRLTSRLEGADFDVALWVGDVALRSLIRRRVGLLAWVLAAAPSYTKAHGVPASPADLVTHECLRALRSPRENRWVLQDERGRQTSVELHGRFEANDAEVLRQALYAGQGIGLRPRGEVAAAVQEGRLVRVLPGWVFAPVPLLVLTPPARARVGRVRAVADTLARSGRLL